VLRRVLAAVIAIVLAVVGGYLVISYASAADERAQEGLQTVDVLVATERIPMGTPASEIGERAQSRSLPRVAVPEGAVADMEEVGDLVTSAEVIPGEVLLNARFTTPEQQRAEGSVPLPEGTENMHQVTLLLEKARALGGNITRGDTVGVFLSFEMEESGKETEGRRTNTTHLTLHNVPVVRVEGAAVQASTSPEDDGEEQVAAESVFVTLALEPQDAERLVFGMEWGQVWLSSQPETAEGDGEIVVMQFPASGRDVYQ